MAHAITFLNIVEHADLTPMRDVYPLKDVGGLDADAERRLVVITHDLMRPLVETAWLNLYGATVTSWCPDQHVAVWRHETAALDGDSQACAEAVDVLFERQVQVWSAAWGALDEDMAWAKLRAQRPA